MNIKNNEINILLAEDNPGDVFIIKKAVCPSPLSLSLSILTSSIILQVATLMGIGLLRKG